MSEIEKEDLRSFFERNLDKTSIGDCWLWKGAQHGTGYGVVCYDGRTTLAHRVSWEIHFGPIPKHNSYHGMCVLHKCDNRACVNPNHLFLGTQDDNMKDMRSKNRDVSADRSRTVFKLTPAKVMEIRQDLLDGKLSLRGIGRKHGVTHNSIWLIKVGKQWSDVK
jgi:hypothetical protein